MQMVDVALLWWAAPADDLSTPITSSAQHQVDRQHKQDHHNLYKNK